VIDRTYVTDCRINLLQRCTTSSLSWVFCLFWSHRILLCRSILTRSRSISCPVSGLAFCGIANLRLNRMERRGAWKWSISWPIEKQNRRSNLDERGRGQLIASDPSINCGMATLSKWNGMDLLSLQFIISPRATILSN